MNEEQKRAKLTNLEFAAEGLFNSWQNHLAVAKEYHDDYIAISKEIDELLEIGADNE